MPPRRTYQRMPAFPPDRQESRPQTETIYVDIETVEADPINVDAAHRMLANSIYGPVGQIVNRWADIAAQFNRITQLSKSHHEIPAEVIAPTKQYKITPLKTTAAFSMPAAFGFEATWCPEDMFYFDHLGANMSNMTSAINRHLALNGMQKWVAETADESIETPSHIYSGTPLGTKKMLRDFEWMLEVMKKIRMIPSSARKRYYNDGGGHIHISVDRIVKECDVNIYGEKAKCSFMERFIRNFAISSINHPWVNWAFNSPIDNVNANSFLHFQKVIVDPNDKTKSVKLGLEELIHVGKRTWFDGPSKSYPVIFREDKSTMEFRFFRMPDTVEEMALHMELAGNWYRHIFDITLNGEWLFAEFSDPTELEEIKYEDACEGLLKFCREIGLDFERVRANGNLEIMKTRYRKSTKKNNLLK